jgi:copper chaperone NosL
MSIVDQRFGGEIVTKKGKIYKFDAVECMNHYLDRADDPSGSFAFILTNTFDKPGELWPAEECVFLISKNMPSPMGGFINPFSTETVALKFLEENEGIIYSWESLRREIN